MIKRPTSTRRKISDEFKTPPDGQCDMRTRSGFQLAIRHHDAQRALKRGHYPHWEKHAQKLKLASLDFLTFSAWPGRIHCIPTDLVPQFKEQPAA